MNCSRSRFLIMRAIRLRWSKCTCPAEYCARKQGWYRVECTKTVDGVKTIRTVEEIQKDILGYLKTVL